MKFEIDDKTGMLAIVRNSIAGEEVLVDVNTHEYFGVLPTNENLEKILQAVKKTQEKLLNKQIQEIQDSKNTITNEEFDEMLKKRKIHTTEGFISIEEIERNQKIVYEIKRKFYNLPENHLWREVYNEIIKKATGEDIKDHNRSMEDIISEKLSTYFNERNILCVVKYHKDTSDNTTVYEIHETKSSKIHRIGTNKTTTENEILEMAVEILSKLLCED